MHAIEANNIDYTRKKREVSESNIELSKISEKANNESTRNNPEEYSKLIKNQNMDDYSNHSMTKNNEPNTRISVRASGGLNGCAQTGSPVMFNKIQSGLVSASCDDRQPEIPWHYTDIYDNVDWINEMIGHSKPSNKPRSKASSGSCSTCIYNFYIENNCKDRNTCHKDSPPGSNPVVMPEIPGVALPKCSMNNTGSRPTGESRRASRVNNKPKHSQAVDQAYVNSINEMYLNKRRKEAADEDDNKASNADFTTDPKVDQKSGIEEAGSSRRRKIEGLDGPPQSTVRKSGASRLDGERILSPARTTGSDHYRTDFDTNYRQVKSLDINDDSKTKKNFKSGENDDGININLQSYFSRTSNKANGIIQEKQLGLKDVFGDNNYDDAGVPIEYVALYSKFLDEHKQSRDKNN